MRRIRLYTPVSSQVFDAVAAQRCVSVYGLEIPPAQLGKEKDAAMEALLRYGKKAIEEDGADGLVLGCTGMADLAEVLQGELQVPVVEPTGAGLWMAVRAAESSIDPRKTMDVSKSRSGQNALVLRMHAIGRASLSEDMAWP